MVLLRNARCFGNSHIPGLACRHARYPEPCDALGWKRAGDAEMQVTEVRLRQMEDGAAAQPLAREVEDSKCAELCLGSGGLRLAAVHRDRGDEVLTRDRKLDISFAPGIDEQRGAGLSIAMFAR